MPMLDDIRCALKTHTPELLDQTSRQRAAVALLLRECEGIARLLFIERTSRKGDPWSGHLAFPGGHLEEGDASLRHAAERETREEIGLDLARAEYLGRLDDLSGAALPVVVSGFAYAVGPEGPFALSDEVEQAFWVPLDHLADVERHQECRFQVRGDELLFPAIDLLGPDRPLLWGLTYRFCARLLALAGHSLPPVP